MCPIENCTDKIPTPFKDAYSNIQHHLWLHHNIDVAESHRLARTVAKPPEPKRNHWKKVPHKKSAALVEFEKKQLELNFGQRKTMALYPVRR
jgi:hypothetical protein